jgi:hypothetical protein
MMIPLDITICSKETYLLLTGAAEPVSGERERGLELLTRFSRSSATVEGWAAWAS